MTKMTQYDIEIIAFRAIQSECFSKARRLLEPLLEYDSEFALMTLGWMYEAGKVAPLDKKLAASLYERAAKTGCLEAYNCLGRVFWQANDLVKARETFTKGAELGNLGSMAWLGVLMLSGQGGPVDLENGRFWVNKAAEKGHFAAKGQLLILEKQNSNSFFRHIIYRFKKYHLAYRVFRDYSRNPYSGKF